ncbi:hypothetical protein [Marinomonas sp.]
MSHHWPPLYAVNLQPDETNRRVAGETGWSNRYKGHGGRKHP